METALEAVWQDVSQTETYKRDHGFYVYGYTFAGTCVAHGAKPEKVGGRKGARAPASLDAPLEDSWADYADDEEKKTKRTNTTPLSETLLKMHASITKHKYAAPFKRPVTEKEAPDYHEVIKNPMDLQTLKKLLESGEVATVDALVEKLVLIFDNTLEYNAKGSDLYKIGVSLKALVQKERELYHERRAQIERKSHTLL